MASLQSVAVFYIMWGAFGKTTTTHDKSLFAMGQLTYSACVILISSKLQYVFLSIVLIVLLLDLSNCARSPTSMDIYELGS